MKKCCIESAKNREALGIERFYVRKSCFNDGYDVMHEYSIVRAIKTCKTERKAARWLKKNGHHRSPESIDYDGEV